MDIIVCGRCPVSQIIQITKKMQLNNSAGHSSVAILGVLTHTDKLYLTGLWFTECFDFHQVVFERFSGQRLPEHSSFALDTSLMESPSHVLIFVQPTRHVECLKSADSETRFTVNFCQLWSTTGL